MDGVSLRKVSACTPAVSRDLEGQGQGMKDEDSDPSFQVLFSLKNSYSVSKLMR